MWASTTRTKLKKLASKQKQALRIIDNENIDIREIMLRMKVLNVYKLNIYQVLNFMFQIKTNIAPAVFYSCFTEVHHPYLTRFSENSFVENQIILNQTKFAVSSRGPRLWNNILNSYQKALIHEATFKTSIKSTLLPLENEIRFF